MTDEKFDENSRLNLKNETLEILPLDSNLMFANSSFNFFDSTTKKASHEDDDKDILIVNSKKNLNKNFQNVAQNGS